MQENDKLRKHKALNPFPFGPLPFVDEQRPKGKGYHPKDKKSLCNKFNFKLFNDVATTTTRRKEALLSPPVP